MLNWSTIYKNIHLANFTNRSSSDARPLEGTFYMTALSETGINRNAKMSRGEKAKISVAGGRLLWMLVPLTKCPWPQGWEANKNDLMNLHKSKHIYFSCRVFFLGHDYHKWKWLKPGAHNTRPHTVTAGYIYTMCKSPSTNLYVFYAYTNILLLRITKCGHLLLLM